VRDASDVPDATDVSDASDVSDVSDDAGLDDAGPADDTPAFGDAGWMDEDALVAPVEGGCSCDAPGRAPAHLSALWALALAGTLRRVRRARRRA